MSKVFFDDGISLDGYIAGPNRGPNNPLGDGGTSIHTSLFQRPQCSMCPRGTAVHAREGAGSRGRDGAAGRGDAAGRPSWSGRPVGSPPALPDSRRATSCAWLMPERWAS
jgi:hypothetical protein